MKTNKTDKSAAQDIAAKEWNNSFDYRSLRNGVQVGNIKMIHLDGVNERAMDIYAAQQLSEYKERLRELLVDRINKFEQERRQCTPGSDAYTLMLGHKYEATKLLELIGKLQPTSSEQSGNSSDDSNNL